MNVLNFSLDAAAANRYSATAKRIAAYGTIVSRYDMLVPAQATAPIAVTDNVFVYPIRRTSNVATLWRLYRTGAEFLQTQAYDVVSVQDAYYVGFLAWFLARRHGCALEVQVHGFEKFTGLRRWLARFVLRRADAVRTVSERMKKKLVEEFGVAEEKVTVVPIQVPVKVKNEKRRMRSEKKGDTFVFLTVGRLVSVKNVAMQIEALAELAKKHTDAELWIVGDGPRKNALQKRAEECQIADKVKFLGWQGNVDALYQQADCFVLSSNSEGWGMAVIEAAAHGLPIIMTDVGLAGEVIHHGISGLVIPVQDTAALAKAMRRVMGKKALRARLAKAARAAVEQLPDEKETLARYRQSWDNARSIYQEKIKK